MVAILVRNSGLQYKLQAGKVALQEQTEFAQASVYAWAVYAYSIAKNIFRSGQVFNVLHAFRLAAAAPCAGQTNVVRIIRRVSVLPY
jgi:hypothetical protein